MRDRIDNDLFFGALGQAKAETASVPEVVFYAGRPRPGTEIGLALRAAATPLRFGIILFLIGWAGILFQASFLQQVVIGAPVFEELAKVGAPIALAALLRVRTLWIRLPLAWIAGAAFGVMEHFVTYGTEPLGSYVQRVLFHAASPGVSMLVYGAVESLPDVRARWAATVPATLFHWANNFSAVVLGFGGVFLGSNAESLAVGIASVIVSMMIVLTFIGILLRERFERAIRAMLAAAIPRLVAA